MKQTKCIIQIKFSVVYRNTSTYGTWQKCVSVCEREGVYVVLQPLYLNMKKLHVSGVELKLK